MKGPTIEVEKILIVKRRDSIIMLLPGNQVRRFSDSLVKQTKDTLLFVNSDTLQIKPYIEIYKEPKEVYKIISICFYNKGWQCYYFIGRLQPQKLLCSIL